MADQETQAPAVPKAPWEEKPVPPAPQDAREHALAREVDEVAPGAVIEGVEFAGQVTLTLAADRLADVAGACKERLGYAFLVDLTVVDWKERPEGRFDVVYWLHRHRDSARLRLKVRVADGGEVPSMTAVWKVGRGSTATPCARTSPSRGSTPAPPSTRMSSRREAGRRRMARGTHERRREHPRLRRQ
jgi:hypothetical protein